MKKQPLTTLPITKPVWSSEPTFLGNKQRPTKVVADPLTKKGSAGSPSTSGGKIPGWNPKFKASNTRVHLLHDKLHGPGVPKNLVAASDTVNKRLFGAVERFEIKAVKQQKLIKHKVEVTYESNPKYKNKRDVVKKIDAESRDKETSAVIGHYSDNNY